MIILHNAKPAEGMTLRGLFQLTGVVMVDPHDNKTMQLPLPIRSARQAFISYLRYREVASPAGRAYVEPLARLRLAALGGLASPW